MDGHGSGGGDGLDSSGSSRVLKKSSEFKWPTKKEWDLVWLSPHTNVPSLCSDEVGEVNMSNTTHKLYVDGKYIKEHCSSSYEPLLGFETQCYQKCALKIFTHPGQNGLPGGLTSYVGRKVNLVKFYLQLGCLAIEIYNHLSKAKLVLDKILRVNYLLSAGENYYVTFVAYDQNDYEFKIYKAAFKGVRDLEKLPYTDKTFDGPIAEARYVLGLLIDCSTDKILVALSMTGVEDDLAAKKKIIEDAKAEGASREISESD